MIMSMIRTLKKMKFRLPFSACFNPSPVSDDQGRHSEECDMGCRALSFQEIKMATNNFRRSNRVGVGGFGTVYKGQLQDGSSVAVKVLLVEEGTLKGESEFKAEVMALSDIRHENLVTLKGCCTEGANRYLVYDLMENGSVSSALLGSEESTKRFYWPMRRDTLYGVARGLAFLHDEVKPHIIHRDIKASNILLDENFVPKISDFGLSKLFTDDVSFISTRVAGTLGYVAPEYAFTGHLSRKSDIYSFGVVLLQIISGRPVVEFSMELGERWLVEKTWEEYTANNLVKMIDPVLGIESLEELIMFLKVGLLCVQQKTSLRPWMPTVVKMLSNEVDIGDIPITRPGIIKNFKHVKVSNQNSPRSAGPKSPKSHSSSSCSTSVNSVHLSI
ncbi:Cold-responsive protein kinase 1-like protein [Drosera capensis]